MSFLKRVISPFSRGYHHPRAPIAALVVAGLLAAVGGGVVATRSAGDHFANATFDKLGGNSHDILDAIADRVVKKITEKNGTLDSAQADLVNRLAGMAGKKLGKVDPQQLIDDVRSQVVAAGLGKLNGISTDQIVAQVTAALIQQASTKLDKVDVNALATAAINNVVKSLDLDKLVKAKLDSLDVQAIVNQAVAKQLGGSTGGSGASSFFSLFGKK